jgi:hypothetical protein
VVIDDDQSCRERRAICQRFLGRAGGNDGLFNDTVKLTLTGIPATGVAIVEFNLFIIRSMDGH